MEETGMISKEAMETTVRLIGQYMVDHANELIITYCSDMESDNILIRMIRRKETGEPCKEDSE